MSLAAKIGSKDKNCKDRNCRPGSWILRLENKCENLNLRQPQNGRERHYSNPQLVNVFLLEILIANVSLPLLLLVLLFSLVSAYCGEGEFSGGLFPTFSPSCELPTVSFILTCTVILLNFPREGLESLRKKAPWLR